MTENQFSIWLYGLYCDMTIKAGEIPLTIDGWLDAQHGIDRPADKAYDDYIPKFAEYRTYRSNNDNKLTYEKWVVKEIGRNKG